MRAAYNFANESGDKLSVHPEILAARRLGWAVEKIRRRHAEENTTDG